MKTSFCRSTAQTRTSPRILSPISFIRIPFRMELVLRTNFNSSTFPFAKELISMAVGILKILDISEAAASSGLMIMEIPISSFIKLISSK